MRTAVGSVDDYCFGQFLDGGHIKLLEVLTERYEAYEEVK